MDLFEILIFIGMILMCIIIMALVESHYEITDVKLTSYNIMLNNIKKNEKVAFISDFHSMKGKLFMKKILSFIEKSGAKKVIICGDMIVGKKNYDNTSAIRLMEELCARYKVYFTYGNHESRMFERNIIDKSGFFESINKLNNLVLVNDKREIINIGGVDVPLYGITLSDEYYHKRKPKELTVEEINNRFINNNMKNEYAIMVCHKPECFEVCAQAGANLVLSGHNHGGTIRLKRFGGVISTSFNLFPKYSAGKYFYKDNIMLLSAGLGVHTIRFRLFNKPEVIVINFTRQVKC